MKNWILVAAVTLTGGTSAFAQGITLGEPGYAGTGCPAGSASAVLSPDATTLSILFDQYSAEAGREVGRTLDRKSCNIAIPVNVPQGYSVSIITIDYRGFTFLPSGSNANFHAEYFFAGQRGPVFDRTYRGPREDDYVYRNSLVGTAAVWSRCGADVTLRVNSSIRVRASRSIPQALATVDSADVNAALIYRLSWRRCS